jgi:outer membrane protein OmpA-like peptidoglycan-associated protein
MRRSLLVLIISGISTGAVASGYALWTYTIGDRAERLAATANAPADEASKPAPASAAAVAALTPPPPATPPGASALLAIEVARIDAGGPSVLAGRSPPNHRVTVLANGREIASVIATDEGQWSAIVSEGIAAGPLELSIVSQAKEGGTPVRGVTRQLVVPAAPASSLIAAAPQPARPQPAKAVSVDNKAPAPRATPQPIERPQTEAKRPMASPSQARAEGDDAASKRALAEFEALVERTRREIAAQKTDRAAPAAEERSRSAAAMSLPPAAQTPATSQAPAASVRAVEGPAASVLAVPETKLAAAIPPAASPPTIPGPRTEPAPAAVQAPIPVPITFVTNRATLTPNGERAAELLAEYLRLKRPGGITLSGHADARGPDGYNMRLSLRRLEAIERYLRAAGYSGKLSLIPRGKREPYLGIDRRRLPLREIHQADRRVELRLTP